MVAGAVGERRWAGSQACVRRGPPSRVLAQERTQAGGLAHQTAVAANWQAPAGLLDPEGNGEAASYDVHDSGGPVLALQWDKLRCGEISKKIGSDESPRKGLRR